MVVLGADFGRAGVTVFDLFGAESEGVGVAATVEDFLHTVLEAVLAADDELEDALAASNAGFESVNVGATGGMSGGFSTMADVGSNPTFSQLCAHCGNASRCARILAFSNRCHFAIGEAV